MTGVSVTHPYFFSQPHIEFRAVTSLDVRIATGNGDWEQLAYDEISKLYISDRKPKAGEAVRLKIMRGSETVLSCDTIPRKVEIESVEASGRGPMHIFWDNDYLFTYKITFQDPPGEENFYFLTIEEDSANGEFTLMGQIDYTSDYVFQVLANTINQAVQGWQPDGVAGYPFSDNGIDGELYTITVNEIQQTPPVGMIRHLPRKVNLYSISRSYFEYMLSILSLDYEENALKGNLLTLGLMEPTRIYSNIKGGAGLMGSYNLSAARVDLLQLNGGWPSK